MRSARARLVTFNTEERGTGGPYDQTQEIAKYWHRFSDNPCNYPHGYANANPRASGHEIPFMHAVRALENAKIDVLAADMPKDDTGDHDGGKGNAVGDLLQDGVGGAQSGRADAVAGIAVDDNGSDDVEDDVEGLQ